jgi:hypothetical protein
MLKSEGKRHKTTFETTPKKEAHLPLDILSENFTTTP